MLYECIHCDDLYENGKEPTNYVQDVICENCLKTIEVVIAGKYKVYTIDDYGEKDRD